MLDLADRHERDHVRGAHPRMPAAVLEHVDPLHRGGGPGNGRAAHRVGVPEDGGIEAMMIGVGLGEDHTRALHVERLDDRVDHVASPYPR